MAGIVIKIVIEDTHPPVWRRVVVPEHISFYDLHQVIQTVFEWEDAHMHIFEAPKDRFEIVTNARDAYTDYFPEKKISVSAIAERESWVRYVYDMGDDWRHKLTFEKRMGDYDKNYALLLKAKGNSFTEDSGGIRGGEQMTGYDAASINQQLEQMHFKEVVPSKKDQQKLEQIYMMQNIQKKVKELVRQSMERRKEGKTLEPDHWESALGSAASEIDKELLAWRDFCGEDEKGSVCKMAPRKTSRELLERMGNEILQNLEYALYQEDDKPDLPTADRVLDKLQKHPEYYFCVFDPKDIEECLKFQSFACQQKNDMDDGTVEKGIAFGFWHLQIPEGTEAAYLFPALDFEERLERIVHTDWEKQYEDMQEFSDKIRKVLLAYGMIEQNAFYDIFEKQWNTGIEKQDFLCLVYLNGVIAGKFDIHEGSSTKERFLCMENLDVDTVFMQRTIYAKNLSYKQFTKKELEKFTKPLYETDQQWSVAEVIAKDYFGANHAEAEKFVIFCYVDVFSGYGVGQILEDMEIYEAELPLVQFCGLWQLLQWEVMNTRLPMLNGYSRIEYQELTGKSAFSLDVFDERELEDTVEVETGLEDMPAQTQEMIYHALFDHRGVEKARALEQVTRHLKVHNNELDVLTALAYADAEKYTKACKILDDVADRTEDESVINMIDVLCDRAENILYNNRTFGDPFMDVEMKPTYRRETPKVGRNDPCPCGSGKKYKKCCGK